MSSLTVLFEKTNFNLSGITFHFQFHLEMAKAFLSKLFKETPTEQLEADRIFQLEELKSGSYKKLKTQLLKGKY